MEGTGWRLGYETAPDSEDSLSAMVRHSWGTPLVHTLELQGLSPALLVASCKRAREWGRDRTACRCLLCRWAREGGALL